MMGARSYRRLQFDEFEVDLVRRVLLRNNRKVQISSRSFDVFAALLLRRGEVVAKQDLMELVWPDVAVEENNLARHISTLRRNLGENAGEHRYILTVPGRGYGFVAEVREVAGPMPWESRLGLLVAAGSLRAALTQLALPIALLALAVLLSAGYYYRENSGGEVSHRFREISLTQIKNTPNFPRAVISPDGRHIAYLAGMRNRPELCIYSRRTESDRVLVPAMAGHSFRGLTFSPDSMSLCYNVHGEGTDRDELWRIPVLGGEPEKLKEGLESPVTFHPGGSRFAYVHESSEEESVLVTADLPGREERRVVSRQLPVFLDYPAWSPHGKSIAFTEVRPTEVTVWEVRLNTGVEKRLTTQSFDYVQRFAWLPKSTGLVLSARLNKSQPYSLFRLSYPEGKLSRITDNLESLRWASVTADGRTILTSAEKRQSTLWVANLNEQASAQRIVFNSGKLILGRWLSDGRIFFEEQVGRERTLWTVQPDGSAKEKLAIDRPGVDPDLCSDGRTLVYWADHSGRRGLWRTDLTRGASSLIVEVREPVAPRCSPDNKWVVYTTKTRDPWETLWKVRLTGGEAVRLTRFLALQPAFSPDGRTVACFYSETTPSPQREPTQICVLDINGERLNSVFPLAASVSRDVKLRYDGTMVTYVDDRNGVSNIWGQPVSGGAPRKLTNFQQGRIFSFDWSPDGRQLSLLRGDRPWDIVLIQPRQFDKTDQ